MALANKKLTGVVETIFLMTKAEYSCISSSTVKEVAAFGGSLSCFVPPLVEERLIEKYRYQSLKLGGLKNMRSVTNQFVL